MDSVAVFCVGMEVLESLYGGCSGRCHRGLEALRLGWWSLPGCIGHCADDRSRDFTMDNGQSIGQGGPEGNALLPGHFLGIPILCRKGRLQVFTGLLPWLHCLTLFTQQFIIRMFSFTGL